MKKSIFKETYLLFLIVIGLFSLSIYSTYALFTAGSTINNVVQVNTSNFSYTLGEALEYQRITVASGEAQYIELNITNSAAVSMYYALWYEMVSPTEITEGIDISYSDSNMALLETGSTTTTYVYITNTTDSDIIVNLGVDSFDAGTIGLDENKSLITSQYSSFDGTGTSNITMDTPSGENDISPTYTHSSTYTVTGTVEDNGSGIKRVTVNGGTATVTDSNFSKDIVLTANTATPVTVVAIDNNSNFNTLTKFVYYDDADPALNVVTPSSESSTSPTYVDSPSYTITGTVSDTGSGIDTVTVNGNKVAVTDGTFSTGISLTEKEVTTITVVATDVSGRSRTVTKYVWFFSITKNVSYLPFYIFHSPKHSNVKIQLDRLKVFV